MANTLSDEIKRKDVNINKLSGEVIADKSIRDQVVKFAVSSTEIMLYYHSYYIVDNASCECPPLFYEYWDKFASLLKDTNSYKRDIGMTIIANLTAVDSDNKFGILYDKFISILNDEKFMTAECCVNNFIKILPNKPEYTNRTIDTFIQADAITSFTPKQKAVLKSNILEVINTVYKDIEHKTKVNEFVKECLTSMSPKTRKTAKRIINSLQL